VVGEHVTNEKVDVNWKNKTKSFEQYIRQNLIGKLLYLGICQYGILAVFDYTHSQPKKQVLFEIASKVSSKFNYWEIVISFNYNYHSTYNIIFRFHSTVRLNNLKKW